jgi:hypothetical protein
MHAPLMRCYNRAEENNLSLYVALLEISARIPLVFQAPLPCTFHAHAPSLNPVAAR